jgi:cytochrome c oxidase assembly protein subunit 15
MRGGVLYEHSHRMLGAAVGLLIITLNLWLWRKEPRPWVKRLGLVALAVVISQGVLGGITVLFFLPSPVSIAHAGLAQAFFCLTVTLALVTSVGWTEADPSLQFPAPERVDALAVITTLVIFLQVMVGASLRHLGTVEGTKGAILVTSVLVIHLIGTLLVAGMIIYTALALLKRADGGGLVGWTYLMLGLLVLQLFLGLGAYLARVEAVNQVQPLRLNVLITTSHLAVGALLLATSLVVALKLTRRSTSSDEMPRWSEASLI